MWRQGDILIQEIDSIPENAVKLKKPIVVTSKATGHQHKIQERKSVGCIGSPTNSHWKFSPIKPVWSIQSMTRSSLRRGSIECGGSENLMVSELGTLLIENELRYHHF